MSMSHRNNPKRTPGEAPDKLNFTNKSPTKICRLCLAQTTTYFSLIENDNSSEMLEALTSLKILSSDEISTVMCLKCRLNLTLAYKIQQEMLRAEERFKQRPQEPPKEIIKEESPPKIIDEKPKTKKASLGPFECPICGKTFPHRTLFSRHKYGHLKKKCPICDKELSAWNLGCHVKNHSESPQICELCGATFKSPSSLRQHVFYSHHTSRHKCRYCDKAFKKKSNRDGHENKEHLGEANFVCETCGKKFYKAKNLNTHVKMTHLKLRPHVCEFCNNAFSSLHALKTHRRRHTNETPYRCEVCGDGFRQKVSLKAHLKSKHKIVEETTCNCGVCGKGFASKVALYTHQRVH